MSVFKYTLKKKHYVGDFKKDNGIRWGFTVYYQDWDKKKKRKKKMGFLTKGECVQAEVDFLRSVQRNSNIPFSTLYEKYLKDCITIHNLKKTTLMTKRSIFEHHILPYFGNISLNEIDEPMIRDFFNKLTNVSKRDNGKDLSPSYKQTIKNQLSSILNYGMEVFGLEDNKCRGIDVGGENTIRDKVWNENEFKKFISSFDNDLLNKTVFNLFWVSGIREGELLGLQLRDFDFVKNTMSITRNYQKIDKGKYEYTTPKTESSIRTVVLPRYVMDLIKQYSESVVGLEEDTRLFQTTKDSLLRTLKKKCIECEITRIPIHSIRHSFITHCMKNNIPVKVVSQMVGHKHVKTTLDIYDHCNVDDQRSVSDMLDEQFRSVG